MIETIDVPATVGKAELADILPFRGATNATVMCLNGTEYQPFALVLQGFAGSGGADQVYAGHYKFRLSQAADAERDAHDLRRLPGLPSVLVTVAPETAVETVEVAVPLVPVDAEAVADEKEPKPRKKRKKHTEAE